LSAADALLDSLFITAAPNPEGVFCVRLWVRGAWRHFFMDGTFPARTDAHVEPLGEGAPGALWRGPPDPAAGTYHPLIAARSLQANEFWPALLEKAWAMLHGSYAAIEGGRVRDRFPCDFFFPHSRGFSVRLEGAASPRAEAQWAQLRGWAARGWPLTVGSKRAAGGEDAQGADGEGIVRGHAFSVVAVVPPPPFAPLLRLLQLRNPHGRTEWNGAFSDADASAWTPALRAHCGYAPGGDDGVFCMPFAALEEKFDHITVTPQVRFAHEGGPWHCAVAGGAVGAAGGGGGDWIDGVLRAPQFLLRSTRAATFTVLAEAEEGGGGGGDGAPLGLSAFLQEGGDGARPVARGDFYFAPPARAAARAAPVHGVDSPFEPVPLGALEERGGARVVNAVIGREGRVGIAVRLGEPAGAALVVVPTLGGAAGGPPARFTLTVLCEEPFSLRVAQPGEPRSSEDGVTVLSAVA
jgi:hypothetical protein